MATKDDNSSVHDDNDKDDVEVTFTIDDSFDDISCTEAVETELPPSSTLGLPKQYNKKKLLCVAAVAGLVVLAAIVGGTTAAVLARNDNTDEPAAAVDIPDDFAGPGNIPDDFAGPGNTETIHPDDVPTSGDEAAVPESETNQPTEDEDNDESTALIADSPAESTPAPEYTSDPPAPSCDSPPLWLDATIDWADLSDDQRMAAAFLGYDEAIWNSPDGRTTMRIYDEWYWSDLTTDDQIAFTYLGYNAGSYENFYRGYSYDTLPPSVQGAADALGYTELIWNNCQGEDFCVPIGSLFWEELTTEQQDDLAVLGYDCWTWDDLPDDL